MPKNKKGGSGHKKKKNKDSLLNRSKRKLIKRTTKHEEYAIIRKAMGNCRFSVLTTNYNKSKDDDEDCNTKTRIALIRGSLKRVRMHIDDLVLVSVRPYQDNKCDIVHKYFDFEIEKLKSQGELDPFEAELDLLYAKKQKELNGSDSEHDEIIDDENTTTTTTTFL